MPITHMFRWGVLTKNY